MGYCQINGYDVFMLHVGLLMFPCAIHSFYDLWLLSMDGIIRCLREVNEYTLNVSLIADQSVMVRLIHPYWARTFSPTKSKAKMMSRLVRWWIMSLHHFVKDMDVLTW